MRDLIEEGNIVFAPVGHGRLEFAVVVRRLLEELRPEAVAVEFPPTLAQAIERGLDRLPYVSVVLYQEKEGRWVYLPLEPQDPLVAAAWLARRHGTPLFFVDRDTEGYPRHREPLPDPYTVRRLGLEAYVEAYRRQYEERPSSREDLLREMTMAYHLQDLGRRFGRVLFVCGLAHYPGVRRLLGEKLALPLGRVRREGVQVANLAEASSREVMSEMPYLAAAFVRSCEEGRDLDRLALHQELLAEAKAMHLKNSREEVTPGQMAVLNRFSRNYALVQGYLTPDLYQLLIAARGAVNDNFAYEVWDLATRYPWQDQAGGLPELRLRGEDLYLDEKKIRLYRRFRHFRRRLVKVPLRERKKEKVPGEWQREWQGQFICSHPPEDLVIEGWGEYLKKKAVQVLSEENQHSQPFVASMLDGLDLRETIRNWHEGRIFVQENRPVQGRVGSIVVIFDPDRVGPGEKERFPWRLTWLGEHDQESDMAFYATPAGEQVVGPGISRCEYGGFMMTYPPRRVVDIWQDRFFDGARTKPERLLLAAIDYSEEKYVAYMAAEPPPERIKSVANYYGKKVLYLPLGQFSPTSLNKIRLFHVLDGHQVRTWAREYIY